MQTKKPAYYGPFFWLSIVSFIVPLFVAFKAFDNAHATTKPEPSPDVSGVDHNLWDYLLKSYVADGLVDYEAMGRDYLFHTYLKQLGEAQPEKLSTSEDRLALMCNAYNAFVINGVISHKVDRSVTEIDESEPFKFFDLKEHIFAGETISLNELEHGRVRPIFGEPRIHVALVCAAKSCPSIRAEAYVGERIDKQLEDQSLQFANSSKYINYDIENNKLMVSSILDWYGEDWDKLGGYLPWLSQRIEDATLKSAVDRAISGQVEVDFLTYDWDLNSQAEPGKSKAGKSTQEFGSGSVPNG